MLEDISKEVGDEMGLNAELVRMVLTWYWKAVERSIRGGEYDRVEVGRIFVMKYKYSMLIRLWIRCGKRMDKKKEWYWKRLLGVSEKRSVEKIMSDCMRIKGVIEYKKAKRELLLKQNNLKTD
jgi:hypothetical protein